ncbi:MAG: hypothetical protein ISS00_03025 [Candidatus Marinimicrobia bacterium]|nr:hypothetical protein [Candidatus Neomarinimicrobiota bacterium]
MKYKINMILSVIVLTIALALSCSSLCKNAQVVEKSVAEFAGHAEVDFSVSCMECHSESTPDIYEDWANSGHGKMNYGCYMCHGDGMENFSVQPETDMCINCHSSASGHLMRMENQGCFDCHDGHTLNP